MNDQHIHGDMIQILTNKHFYEKLCYTFVFLNKLHVQIEKKSDIYILSAVLKNFGDVKIIVPATSSLISYIYMYNEQKKFRDWNLQGAFLVNCQLFIKQYMLFLYLMSSSR